MLDTGSEGENDATYHHNPVKSLARQSCTSSPSFPRRRAVYETRTIRWQHLSVENRESHRDSSETRQFTGRGGFAWTGFVSALWILP